MMSTSEATFCSMNADLVADTILSHLDGTTLTATASACSPLRDAVSDKNLWINLCTTTWPSTQRLVSSATLKGFKKFYANAFPLVLSQPQQATHNLASPSNLASLVDIYYKGKCILSRVLDAIPEPSNVGDDNHHTNIDNDELLQWLLDCPYSLDMFPDSHDDCITYLARHDLRHELEDDIRLSWILFDKKNGEAVNLSSWKPMFVDKNLAPGRRYTLHFGSIIKLDTSLFAECKIEVKFQMIQNSGNAKWTEISMRVEDTAGANLGLTKSLRVFNQALNSKRTTKHLDVEKANNEYKMYKTKMKRQRDGHGFLIDKLYALVGLLILTTISYGCTKLIQ